MTDIEIKHLEDVPHLAPTVARWIEEEWRRLPIHDYFDDVVTGKPRVSGLPQTLVAVHDGVAIGTVSLLRDDMETRPDLNPWVGCLFTERPYRNQRLGTELVRAAERVAETLGIDELFLYTVRHANLFARLGWEKFGEEAYEGEICTLMRRRPSARSELRPET